MSIEHDEQVTAYGQWVVEYVNRRWEVDLLSFMFNPIAAPKAQRTEIMNRELERTYAKCRRRMFRRSRLAMHLGWLPIWIISPDWPVPKADKDHYRDIVINDGEHRHAVALTPPHTRLKTTFNDYITEEQRHFTGRDRTLWRIDAQPITNAAEYATAYALKSVERGRISPGEVFVLPRSKSEL
jgi:hypothetical protein